MYKTIITLAFAVLLSSASLFGQTKTEEFEVLGNCGMCEKRIEKAANSVEGVEEADWNKKTKMMEVKFDDSKTDAKKIHKAIADVGHSTREAKASDEAYNKLHSCCKYERGAFKHDK